MDDDDNELGNVYQNMLSVHPSFFQSPSDSWILIIYSIKAGAHPSYVKSAWNNFIALLSLPMANLVDVPTRAKSAMNRSRNISRDVAGKLFDEEWSVSDPESGIVKRDVMSLLGEHCGSKADESNYMFILLLIQSRQTLLRMDGRSLLEKRCSIRWGEFASVIAYPRLTCGLHFTELSSSLAMVSGSSCPAEFTNHLQETTSNVLTWSLWELAKNQGVQSKLRDEILQYAQPSSGEVSVSEYENMKYTVAFIKVGAILLLQKRTRTADTASSSRRSSVCTQ